MRRFAVMFAVFTMTVLITGCSDEKTVTMPDVVGKTLEIAISDVERAGINDEAEVLGGGMFGVLDESNWTVCSQEPASGQNVSSPPRLTVDRTCDSAVETSEEPAEEIAPVPEESAAEVESAPEVEAAKLDDVYAAQFLALAWEDRMIYGGTVHWIADRITTPNDDGTYTFKIGATLKNGYGTEYSGTIEGDVGGTNDAPVILDSIMYTDAGETFDYFG